MKEGWYGNDYLILFEDKEIPARGQDYNLARYLPGHALLGFASWDNFIVREEKTGRLYKALALPIGLDYREPWEIDLNAASAQLERDARYHGKIKWYTHPVIFGGDPEPGDNMIWIPHKEHAEAVLYWNNIYTNMANTVKHG